MGFLFIYVLVYSVAGMRQQLRGRGGRKRIGVEVGMGRGQGGKAQKRSCGEPEIGGRNVFIISTAFEPHCL